MTPISNLYFSLRFWFSSSYLPHIFTLPTSFFFVLISPAIWNGNEIWIRPSHCQYFHILLPSSFLPPSYPLSRSLSLLPIFLLLILYLHNFVHHLFHCFSFRVLFAPTNPHSQPISIFLFASIICLILAVLSLSPWVNGLAGFLYFWIFFFFSFNVFLFSSLLG